MTFEFFKTHNEKYLTDEGINVVWHGTEEQPGAKVHFADTPETEKEARTLTLTSMMFSLAFPEYARTEEAA